MFKLQTALTTYNQWLIEYDISDVISERSCTNLSPLLIIIIPYPALLIPPYTQSYKRTLPIFNVKLLISIIPSSILAHIFDLSEKLYNANNRG